MSINNTPIDEFAVTDPGETARAKNADVQAREAETTSATLERRLLNSGVILGLCTMAVAAVWIVLAVKDGKFFALPITLFVLGCGSVYRGWTKVSTYPTHKE